MICVQGWQHLSETSSQSGTEGELQGVWLRGPCGLLAVACSSKRTCHGRRRHVLARLCMMGRLAQARARARARVHCRGRGGGRGGGGGGGRGGGRASLAHFAARERSRRVVYIDQRRGTAGQRADHQACGASRLGAAQRARSGGRGSGGAGHVVLVVAGEQLRARRWGPLGTAEEAAAYAAEEHADEHRRRHGCEE